MQFYCNLLTIVALVRLFWSIEHSTHNDRRFILSIRELSANIGFGQISNNFQITVNCKKRSVCFDNIYIIYIRDNKR